MSKLIKIFKDEFIQGVKETPRMYFEPVSAMFRVVYRQAISDNSPTSKADKNKAA